MSNYPETISRYEEAKTKAATMVKQISVMDRMACGWREASWAEGHSSDDFDVRVYAKVLNRCRRIEITLELNDTYTVRLFKIPTMRAKDPTPVMLEEVSDVYCDQLSSVVYGVCNK